jgi:hypothetical protein
MEERRKKNQEQRRWKKIKKSLHHDGQVAGDERVKRLRMSKEKLFWELEKSQENVVPYIDAPQQSAEPQQEEKKGGRK